MFVTEHLELAGEPLFSYEIIPPPRGRGVRDILEIVEQLVPFHPPFIDVTSHGAMAEYIEQGDGTVRRRIRQKRPGTVSLCGIIQNRYGIDTVPHMLCRGFTREETEDAMIELAYLGIHNVLAIRGDETNYRAEASNDSSFNTHSDQLVRQLDDLRRGTYLEEIDNSESIETCIGVGGYPEKHTESPNLNSDLLRLKKKVDAGADYVVTQMFFDNQRFFDFCRQCREIGITVPIIPGLKVISSRRQLNNLPKHFHVDLPDDLVNEIQDDPRHARTIGVRWATQQVRELISHGIKCIHFFVVNDVVTVLRVLKGIR